MKTFKIRASAAHLIIGESKGGGGLTEKQAFKLKEFEAKDERTVAQERDYKILIAKRDKPPELSATAKTYCRTWLKEQPEFYNRREEFRSKYTDKGNFCEDGSIRFLNSVLLTDWKKNEVYKENEWMTGTCDIDDDDDPSIVDTKNSWSDKTFPTFNHFLPDKDKKYETQVQCYMELYDKPKAIVAYVLSDTPHHLIVREARYKCRELNIDFDSPEGNEVFSEVQKFMTYSDVDDSLKYKLFPFKRDPVVIEKVKKRVELCRIYINELIESL